MRFFPPDLSDNPHPIDAAGVVDRTLSTSFVAALPEPERDRVADRLREIVAPLGPSFPYPCVSELEAWRLGPDRNRP